MRYEERLKLLKDLFSTTDNTYIQKQLNILETEIEMSIMDAQIETLTENLDRINNL